MIMRHVRGLRRVDAHQLLVNMCFALLGLYVVFVISSQGSEKLSIPFCAITGALMHYFMLVTIFSMAAEAVDLFIKLVIVLGAKIHHFVLKTVLLSWSEYLHQ